MNITETLYVVNREDWRAWLEANYKTRKEIWLVYYRKETGKPRISYNAAVEEALCFGWIDSTAKKLDEESFAQRFSPRNPRSAYSQPNKERLKIMIAQGKVVDEVLVSVVEVMAEAFEFPADILAALQANPRAWENYQNFSEPYRRIRVAYIEGARSRPEEFQKRLRNFIKMTEKGKRIGIEGMEEYY